jgi:hypothetical protein
MPVNPDLFSDLESNLVDAAEASVAGGFIHIRGYTAKSGEVANHTLNGRVDWKATLGRSIEALKTITAEQVASDCPACNDLDTAKKALSEVKASYEKSYGKLDLDDDGEGSTSNYEPLAPGVSTLPNSDTLYVWALSMSKEVVVAGTYKKVNSSQKTLVKRYIERLTPASKFRRFKLASGAFEYVSIGGVRLA